MDIDKLEREIEATIPPLKGATSYRFHILKFEYPRLSAYPDYELRLTVTINGKWKDWIGHTITGKEGFEERIREAAKELIEYVVKELNDGGQQ